MPRLLLPAALALLAACGAPAEPPHSAAPVERSPPEARGQQPAFAGQTRAPAVTSGVAFQVQTIASGLDHPWSLAWMPDGRMLLVTERPGRLRIIEPSGALSPPIKGAPKVESGGQGGLYDVVVDPHFAANHLIYLAYFERRPRGQGLSVARGVLDPAAGALNNLQVIFRAGPATDGALNIGGRLVFLADGTLAVSVGDRFETRDQAQSLASDLGKIVRILPGGGAPPDNPFSGRAGARPEIWTLGHRNPEAMAIDPASGKLWEVEHGARGGDEVNIVEPGKNYGWPVITYGIDYSGAPIGVGRAKAGMQQPLYYWDPSIAPSGMAFYDGRLFPAWKGNLFVGALKGEHLVRLVLAGERVTGEERLLANLHERIRDVREGPDGALYVLTDNAAGRVLRLAPAR